MRRTVIIAALATLAAAMPAAAQFGGGRWVTVATQTVNRTAETDIVTLRGNQRYSAMRLCAARRGIRIRDVDALYENGGRQDFQVRDFLPDGRCTRALDFKGKRRNIYQIRLRYDAEGPGHGMSIIRIQART